jgi:HK97 gp10 family phage protein
MARISTEIIEIIGLQELNDLVNGIPQAFNQIFGDTANKFAQTMDSQARSKAPVKTGFLRNSIGATANQTELQFFADARYAIYVDQGTWKMLARPFFTSTKDEQVPKMIDELNKGLANFIKSKVK